MSERSIISVAVVVGVLGYLAVTAVDPANKTLGGVAQSLGAAATNGQTGDGQTANQEQLPAPVPLPGHRRGGKLHVETAREHEQHQRECVANGYQGPRCYWMKAPDGKPW